MALPETRVPTPGPGPDSVRTGRVALGWLLLLVAAYVAVLAWRLDVPPVLREAESRVEQVTRNMLASGDWLVPRLDAGQERLQKPPLYYWLASGAATLLGEGRFALRLPAVLASATLVVLACAWAWAALGARAGLLAAACTACMPGLAQFGRLGVAETLLAACSTAALAACARAAAAGRRANWTAVGCFALAVLAKATTALLLVGLPIALWLAGAGRARRLVSARALGLLLLGLLPALAWYLVLLARVPGARDTLLGFALLPFGVRLPEAAGNALHARPPLYYCGQLVTLAAPLLPFLPLLALRAWRTRGWRDQPALRLAALACAGPFVVFSIIPQKQDHYLLPLLAPLAVLLAEALRDAAGRAATATGWRAASVACVLLAGLAAGAMLYVAWGGFGLGLSAGLALAALAAGLLGWMVAAAVRGRPLAFAGGLAALTFGIMIFWFGCVDAERQRLEAGALGGEESRAWQTVAAEHPLVGRLMGVGEDDGERDA